MMKHDVLCPSCNHVHDVDHFDGAEAVKVLAQRHPEIDWAAKLRDAPGFVKGAWLQMRHSDEVLEAVRTAPRADAKVERRDARRRANMSPLSGDARGYMTAEEAARPQHLQPLPSELAARRDAALDRKYRR